MFSKYNSVFNKTVDLKDEDKVIFSDEIKEEDLIYLPPKMDSKVLLKELIYIIDKMKEEIYCNLFFYFENNRENSGMERSNLLEKESSLALELYSSTCYLRLDLFVIGCRAISLTKNKVKTTPHTDDLLRDNFRLFNETSYGSVLSSNHWWILTNDMLVLGLVHNRKYIYMSSPRRFHTIYIDFKNREDYIVIKKVKEKQYCMTNFAREILGFLIAGYTINKNRTTGEVLSPPKKYKNMSLLDYVNAIKYFESSGLDFLMNDKLVGIDFNFANMIILE
ncbi:MAG: hypothetical protein KFW09_05950 [Oscillospiraceae bacterium]|nr:hypothetical protein [Oscillospiraceae bacterium]